MHDLKVTLIQSSLVWEDKTANLQMFSEKIDKIEGHTDIVVLPEMFNSGFTMNTQAIGETMDAESVQWLNAQSRKIDAVVCGSLIVKEDNKFYNRFVCADPNGPLCHYDKRHLFRMAKENEHFSAGKSTKVITVKGWKINLQVCYDLRFPVWSRNKPVMKNAKREPLYDVLIYVANWPERRSHAWKSLLVARAIENQCHVIGVNRVGVDGNDVVYSGDSMVVDPKGEVISSIKSHEEASETVTLSYSDLQEFRSSFPLIEDADEFEVRI